MLNLQWIDGLYPDISVSEMILKTQRDLKLNIFEDNSSSSNTTLIIAHWYGRNWEYYNNTALEILSKWKYKRVVSFDFPWHDWETNISFDDSLGDLKTILECIQNQFNWKSIIWWHSFWAFVSAYLSWQEGLEEWNKLGLSHMVLSSLPYSMNNQMLTKLAKDTIWKRSHEEMLNWLPLKLHRSISWRNNNSMKFWNLVISDWSEYVREFFSMPSVEDMSEVKVSTTLVRARADFILWVWTSLSESWVSYFWKQQEKRNFQSIESKFIDSETVVIPWGWHGLKVPTTHKTHPEKWPNQVKKLVQVIVDVGERYSED